MTWMPHTSDLDPYLCPATTLLPEISEWTKRFARWSSLSPRCNTIQLQQKNLKETWEVSNGNSVLSGNNAQEWMGDEGMSATATENKITKICNRQKAMEKWQNKAEVIIQPELKHRLFNCMGYWGKGINIFQV